MKLAFLADGLFPLAVGGMQRHSRALATELARCGVDVDLYYPASGSDAEHLAQELDDVDHLTLVPVAPPRSRRYPGHYLVEQYQLSAAIASSLRDRAASQVIYANGFTAWSLFRRRSGWPERTPIVLNMHGYEMYQAAPNARARLEQPLLRAAAGYQLRNADYVVSFGGGITSTLLKAGVHRDRILEITGAVSFALPTAPPRLPRRPRRFLFVGRDERRKGASDLLNLLSDLGDQFPATFEFVGPFGPERRIQQRNVVFHGQVTDTSQLMNLYAGADVLVCPSYAEGLPTVILEAMAMGVVPIATRVGAVETVVDETNGWLITPGSRSELRDAVHAAAHIAEEALYAKKLACQERIRRRHTWSAVTRMTIAALERVATPARSTAR